MEIMLSWLPAIVSIFTLAGVVYKAGGLGERITGLEKSDVELTKRIASAENDVAVRIERLETKLDAVIHNGTNGLDVVRESLKSVQAMLDRNHAATGRAYDKLEAVQRDVAGFSAQVEIARELIKDHMASKH